MTARSLAPRRCTRSVFYLQMAAFRPASQKGRPRNSKCQCAHPLSGRAPAPATCSEPCLLLTPVAFPARPLFGEFGNSEVEYLRVSVRPQHDVFGFDVAMQDPAFVCGGQGRADLDSDVQRIA